MKSVVSFAAALAVAAAPFSSYAAPQVCADCVKANMEVLTSDALRGRACGTEDEHAAARFVADKLKSYGVRGAGPDGAHLQRVDYQVLTYAAPPALSVGAIRFTQGDSVVLMNPKAEASGEIVVLGPASDPAVAAGKVVVLDGAVSANVSGPIFRAGAIALVVAATEPVLTNWADLATRAPPAGDGGSRNTIFATPEAYQALRAAAGQIATIAAPRGAPLTKTTYNVLGLIPGKAADADKHAILLSAHYDHVGVRGGAIYRGANDDASGTAAVLELARILAKEAPSKRTVQFALFGCEEAGGHGAKYFLAHPPLPLGDIAANLEFEMIGLPDPQRPKTLMLTGWERSNLGPTLKAQGADIGPDLYPEQNFFARSDNYALALRGVVAQTISAWPTPPTYHDKTDDLAHIDLGFMTGVIQSMVKPVRWLLNSDFRPEWNAGQKP
ncbi:MAG: M20/M25/M40 family metallo-hydrolase [Alphaproteobacteria bacterium]|nr:M20/M25/M40 family metallo-hydrolase [Alphaproteobacteria bacterium]MBU1513001.1 M20/M25/M40 family metallo-hydrolase [Alphaproteobacteria bacterium]MBU2095109.1 M20/M25/M40 family metallo-hydrolase [Alphaproteobacteria bacterium]MBU2153042.1 M20/M25/M40 family metallo-hydrolase [Alphaproteobacteria bacterium]MBU2306360.1 M20/M25/M40 family metallo-hydrolase [Alphaproteobacteria bacterium]